MTVSSTSSGRDGDGDALLPPEAAPPPAVPPLPVPTLLLLLEAVLLWLLLWLWREDECRNVAANVEDNEVCEVDERGVVAAGVCGAVEAPSSAKGTDE